jgi:hypothetical protein
MVFDLEFGEFETIRRGDDDNALLGVNLPTLNKFEEYG